MGFPRQEYWSGGPFPSPGDLPDPGIEPGSLASQVDPLPSEPPGKPKVSVIHLKLPSPCPPPAHHHPSVNTAYWNYHCSPFVLGVSLVAQLVKNPPAMQEIQVRSLGQEDPLEKETATCSSILAWKIPWTEEPGRLQSRVSQELDRT